MQIDSNTAAITAVELQLRCTVCKKVVYKESFDEATGHKMRKVRLKKFGMPWWVSLEEGEVAEPKCCSIGN